MMAHQPECATVALKISWSKKGRVVEEDVIHSLGIPSLKLGPVTHDDGPQVVINAILSSKAKEK